MELIGGVDAAPVEAEAADQLEDEIERVLTDAHPLGGGGPQPDASKRRTRWPRVEALCYPNWRKKTNLLGRA